jgi:hypothetical protein
LAKPASGIILPSSGEHILAPKKSFDNLKATELYLALINAFIIN